MLSGSVSGSDSESESVSCAWIFIMFWRCSICIILTVSLCIICWASPNLLTYFVSKSSYWRHASW